MSQKTLLISFLLIVGALIVGFVAGQGRTTSVPGSGTQELPVSLSFLTSPAVSQWRADMEGTLVAKTSDSFTLEQGGSVSGTVLESVGQTPVSGAWVTARDPESGNWRGNDQTGADGSYTITGLLTGSYKVEVDATDQNFVREYYDGALAFDDASPVSVTAPNDTAGIDFTLEVGGSISGISYESDGGTQG